MVNISLPVCPGKFHLYQCTNSKACKYLRLCDIFDRFCPYTTATSTATLSSAHQISENSDQQQPQQRSASHGGGAVAGAHTREVVYRKRVSSTFFHIFHIFTHFSTFFHPHHYISQTVAANYTIVKRKCLGDSPRHF